MTLTQTKCTEESVELQQFSTPLPSAYLVAYRTQLTPNDVVIEPSVGTGILAKFAELHGCQLVLNEWSERRLAILQQVNLPVQR